jgi:hypothetical protein
MEVGFGFKRPDESTNQRSFDDSFGWSQTQSRESADQSEHSEDLRANAFWNSLATINTNVDYAKLYESMFNMSSQQESSDTQHIARINFEPHQVTPPEDDSNSNPTPRSPHSSKQPRLSPPNSSNQSSSPSLQKDNTLQPYFLNVKHLEVPDSNTNQLEPPMIQSDEIFHQQLVLHLQQQQQQSPLRKSGGSSTQLNAMSSSPTKANTTTTMSEQQSSRGSSFNSLNLRIEINPEISSFTAIDTDDQNKKTPSWKDLESEGKASASPGSQFRVNPWKSKKDKQQLTPTEFSAGSPTCARRDSPWNLSPTALKVHNPWKSKSKGEKKDKAEETASDKKSKELLSTSLEKSKKCMTLFLVLCSDLTVSELIHKCHFER